MMTPCLVTDAARCASLYEHFGYVLAFEYSRTYECGDFFQLTKLNGRQDIR